MVGTLTTVDPDLGDTHTYTLVSGTGSGDNASFQVVGDALQTAAPLNFETKSSYAIRIRTTDSTTRFFEEAFTVSVTNVNEAPTGVSVTPSIVAENQPSGTTVGTLAAIDPDSADTHTFTLVAGTGSTDNGSFTITGSSLNTAAIFNFEAKSTYSIRVRATDGGALFGEQELTIFVGNVNEAPTDISLTGSTVPENLPAGTPVGTFITTDPDAAATHTYTLVAGTGSTDNASFAISGAGLTTIAPFNFEVKSSYSIRVRSTDAGGLFFEEAFTITVTNVNEAPVNTVPSAQTVNEDTDLTFSSGTGNALSIADVDAGVGSLQTTVSTLNGTITPASGSGATVTGSGTSSAQITGTLTQVNAALSGLRYRGTANWNSTRGSATLTIATNDQGNTGSGTAQTDSDSVAITVNAVNDAPAATAKSYTAQANMKVVGLTGLLTGASDPDTGDVGYTASLSVGTLSASNPAGATLTLTSASTGTFDFDPPPGTTGAVTFTYTVCDTGNPGPGLCSAATTVTVTVAGPVIWFVNAAAPAGGNGRLSSPFNLLSAADAVDAANHAIFLYSGTYATGITLNAGEKLVGQGASGPATFDLLFGISPPTGTIARPAIATGTATVQGTVTLANTALLRGLALSTGTATALSGTGPFTGIDVSQTSVTTTTGTGVTLNNAVGSYSFSSISTNGAANGILLDAMGVSTFSATGGSIVGATTRGVDINGSSGNFTYGGSISSTGAGRSVEITNRTGGTVDLNGLVTDNSTGINLSTNGTGLVRFDGGVVASTGANIAFNSAVSGNLAVTDPNAVGTAPDNTLTTANATALNITNTTIHADDLNFRSISSNAAGSGIVLTTTGASGGLTVTGNGGSCTSAATCTGGAIQGSTGTGISLTNVLGGASLTRMFVGGSGDDGIGGSNVTGLTLDNATVTGNGNAASSGGVHGDHGVDFTDLTGTATFTSSNVSSNIDSNVVISNNSGVLNMAVTGGAYSGATGGMGDGIFVEGLGTGSQNLNVQGPITFANNVGDHVQHGSDAANTSDSDVTINNATMTSPAAAGGGPFCALNILGGGITVSHGGNSNTDLTLTNNNIQNSCIGAIAVGTTGSVGDLQSAQVDATIQNNVIGTAGVAGSGSVQGNGIFVDSNGNGLVRTLITGNTIRQWTNRNGIHLDVLDGDAEMSATVRNNIITEPNSAFAGTSTRGMTIQLGAQQTGDSIDACLDIGHATDNALKNQVAGTGEAPQPDIRYLHEGPGSVVQLAGYAGPAAPSITDIANYLQPRNNRVGTPTVTGIATASTGGGSTTSTVASCPQPAP
jgi:hypothetical protein